MKELDLGGSLVIVCLPSVLEAPSLVPHTARRYQNAGELEWSPSIASVVHAATVHRGVCGRVSFSFPEPETSAHLKSAQRFPRHIA